MWEEADQPATILIADEDTAAAGYLAHVLRQIGGVRVTSGLRPEEIRAACAQERPDLLILDVRLLMAAGGRPASGVETPLLVVSGHDAPSVRRQALVTGANDFLLKPYDPVDVFLRVGNLLDICSLRRELRWQQQVLARNLGQITLLEMSRRALKTGLAAGAAIRAVPSRRNGDGHGSAAEELKHLEVAGRDGYSSGGR